MSTLQHKDFLAEVELDEDAGILHGRVINTRAVLTFYGATVAELKEAFAETIDVYEEWCRERGKEPERPYSGNFTLRVSPDLHRRVAAAAARSGRSLNAFIKDALERVA
jgi:predicted HicB family RNase H-like nuclease